MKCPTCSGELRVTHTFPAGEHGQTRDYKCLGCGKKTTSVTFLVPNRDEIGAAREMASKIREGKIRVANEP